MQLGHYSTHTRTHHRGVSEGAGSRRASTIAIFSVFWKSSKNLIVIVNWRLGPKTGPLRKLIVIENHRSRGAAGTASPRNADSR